MNALTLGLAIRLVTGCIFVLLGAIWFRNAEAKAYEANMRHGEKSWRTPSLFRLLGLLFALCGAVMIALSLFQYLHPEG